MLLLTSVVVAAARQGSSRHWNAMKRGSRIQKGEGSMAARPREVLISAFGGQAAAETGGHRGGKGRGKSNASTPSYMYLYVLNGGQSTTATKC